ncbi:unnamed protein product [Pseudo-nitzschia multistriata]|uniref:Uncharacterized protein n=1 Tax=Pseudo-nitzschia multistriata TaxID=183589 RepID=A0A448ZAF0_9STRA|nr:unnamed protein product [Pseudo-nitzschia multistriata]
MYGVIGLQLALGPLFFLVAKLFPFLFKNDKWYSEKNTTTTITAINVYQDLTSGYMVVIATAICQLALLFLYLYALIRSGPPDFSEKSTYGFYGLGSFIQIAMALKRTTASTDPTFTQMFVEYNFWYRVHKMRNDEKKVEFRLEDDDMADRGVRKSVIIRSYRTIRDSMIRYIPRKEKESDGKENKKGRDRSRPSIGSERDRSSGIIKAPDGVKEFVVNAHAVLRDWQTLGSFRIKLRIFLSFLINYCGLTVVLFLLPIQLAHSESAMEFILNSVAAGFIIEMDDYGEGKKIVLRKESPGEEHRPFLEHNATDRTQKDSMSNMKYAGGGSEREESEEVAENGRSEDDDEKNEGVLDYDSVPSTGRQPCSDNINALGEVADENDLETGGGGYESQHRVPEGSEVLNSSGGTVEEIKAIEQMFHQGVEDAMKDVREIYPADLGEAPDRRVSLFSDPESQKLCPTCSRYEACLRARWVGSATAAPAGSSIRSSSGAPGWRAMASAAASACPKRALGIRGAKCGAGPAPGGMFRHRSAECRGGPEAPRERRGWGLGSVERQRRGSLPGGPRRGAGDRPVPRLHKCDGRGRLRTGNLSGVQSATGPLSEKVLGECLFVAHDTAD